MPLIFRKHHHLHGSELFNHLLVPRELNPGWLLGLQIWNLQQTPLGPKIHVYVYWWCLNVLILEESVEKTDIIKSQIQMCEVVGMGLLQSLAYTLHKHPEAAPNFFWWHLIQSLEGNQHFLAYHTNFFPSTFSFSKFTDSVNPSLQYGISNVTPYAHQVWFIYTLDPLWSIYVLILI